MMQYMLQDAEVATVADIAHRYKISHSTAHRRLDGLQPIATVGRTRLYDWDAVVAHMKGDR